jgi:hypothetical protein
MKVWVRGPAIRMMIKFVFPTDAGDTAIREGTVTKDFQALSEELKSEIAYFSRRVENGRATS